MFYSLYIISGLNKSNTCVLYWNSLNKLISITLKDKVTKYLIKEALKNNENV